MAPGAQAQPFCSDVSPPPLGAVAAPDPQRDWPTRAAALADMPRFSLCGQTRVIGEDCDEVFSRALIAEAHTVKSRRDRDSSPVFH
jgi:hypothetical protein